ncbi:UNVERIFIED_CONTAM: hypothetical protein FKN15_039552 [Acipenser sinensis]
MGVKQREGELVQEYGVRKWEAYRDYSESEDPKEQDQVFVQELVSGLGPHLQKSIELGVNPGNTYDAVMAWGGMVENRRKENKEGKGDVKKISMRYSKLPTPEASEFEMKAWSDIYLAHESIVFTDIHRGAGGREAVAREPALTLEHAPHRTAQHSTVHAPRSPEEKSTVVV